MRDEHHVLERLVALGEGDDRVDAMILTSSRARADDTVDAMSDYDVIVAVTDPRTFLADSSWRSSYAQPLASWGDESVVLGLPTSFCGVVYDDGVKIDWTIWPCELLARVVD